MDREADVDHMPPSMFNTLSPGQSSPRLEASPLVFTIPLSPHPYHPSPVPPFLPHRSSRPLTFYHHNRYIIPRSVFYSRVTPWNAFVRDIVPPLLSSPPFSSPPPPSHPLDAVSPPPPPPARSSDHRRDGSFFPSLFFLFLSFFSLFLQTRDYGVTISP